MEYKKSDLTTISQIARHSGVSRDAVKKWGLNSVKTSGRLNYYYLGDVYKKLREMNPGNTKTKKKRNFDFERTRKEKEMADKLEMENQVRRGELIEAKEVEDALIEFVTLSKNKPLGLKTRIVKVIMAAAGVSISHENQKK